MKLLLQRVESASVAVAEKQVAAIGVGLLVFVGVAPDDSAEQVSWLVDKLLGLRIFPAEDPDLGKPMDRSIVEVSGEILVVSQFTLAADTSRGRRPSFGSAASPDHAQTIYNAFVERLRESMTVETGVFGADMKVSLVNDGPVTFILEK